MKEIVADPTLVAYCGLYCGACPRYLRGPCPGCRENEKATWCKVRSCCIEHEISSCGECRDYEDPKECGKFNNLISRVFGFVFRSDRRACVLQIRDLGLDGHAQAMADLRRPSIKR